MANLLSAAEIATITGITEGDIPANVLTFAEDQVERVLGKNYGDAQSETETFYLYTDQSYIQLKHQNIVAVSEFTIEDVDEDGLSEDDGEFKLFKEEGIIYSTYLCILKEISITYTYGNCTAGNLDKYLHLLYVLKILLRTNPDIIPEGKVSERIGDYSINYNVADLKQRPQAIEEEINRVIASGEDTLHFI